MKFAWIVTAEQAGTYRPSRDSAEVTIKRMSVERGDSRMPPKASFVVQPRL